MCGKVRTFLCGLPFMYHKVPIWEKIFILTQDYIRLISFAYTLQFSVLTQDYQVNDGAYDGTKLNCTTQAVLSDNKLDASKGYSVPLEIMPSGQFEPLYKTTLSVQVSV